MARWHRLALALGLLAAMPVVVGGGVALAAGPLSSFALEPRSGLEVTRVGPTSGEQLMPGGSYRESFAISVTVDSVYTFTLHLSSPDLSIATLRVAVADATGHTLYAGPAIGASFSGRHLAALQADLLSVRIFGASDGEWLIPGATIAQSWTVTAQPT